MFNPVQQYTKYNKKPVPGKPRTVYQINETPSETARYAWVARYEVVPSDSPFNQFLNGLKSGSGPVIRIAFIISKYLDSFFPDLKTLTFMNIPSRSVEKVYSSSM